MTKENILEKAKGFAVLALEKYGELRPMISVHTVLGSVSTLPYQGSARDKMLAVATIRLCRSSGILDFALLLSEAWMATLGEGEKPGPDTLPPSKRVDKKEIVIAHLVCADGSTDTAIWPITRDSSGKPSLGAALARADKSESWLDEAVR